MVLPWMGNGNLRGYIRGLQSQGRLTDKEFVVSVNTWVRQRKLSSCS